MTDKIYYSAANEDDGYAVTPSYGVVDDQSYNYVGLYSGATTSRYATFLKLNSVDISSSKLITSCVLNVVSYTSTPYNSSYPLGVPVLVSFVKAANPSVPTTAEELVAYNRTSAVPWWLKFSGSQAYSSPDLSIPFQELISDPSWSIYSNLIVLIEYDTSYGWIANNYAAQIRSCNYYGSSFKDLAYNLAVTYVDPPKSYAVTGRGSEGTVEKQGFFGAVSRGAKGIATTSNFCEVVPARGANGAVSIPGLYGTTSRGMVTNTEYPYDVTSDVVVNASGSRTLEGDVIDSEVGRVERAISGRGAIASLGFEGNACSSRGFTCDVSQVFLVSALAGSGRGAVAHLGSLLDTRSARGVAGTATQKHSGNLKACSSRGSFLTVVDRNVSIKACRSCCAIGQVTIDGIATGIVCNGRGLEGDVVKNGIIDGTVCGRRGCKCSVLTELFADGDIYQSRGLGKEINIIDKSLFTGLLQYLRR